MFKTNLKHERWAGEWQNKSRTSLGQEKSLSDRHHSLWLVFKASWNLIPAHNPRKEQRASKEQAVGAHVSVYWSRSPGCRVLASSCTLYRLERLQAQARILSTQFSPQHRFHLVRGRVFSFSTVWLPAWFSSLTVGILVVCYSGAIYYPLSYCLFLNEVTQPASKFSFPLSIHTINIISWRKCITLCNIRCQVF